MYKLPVKPQKPNTEISYNYKL